MNLAEPFIQYGMNSGPVFAVHFFDRFICAAFKRNAVRHQRAAFHIHISDELSELGGIAFASVIVDTSGPNQDAIIVKNADSICFAGRKGFFLL